SLLNGYSGFLFFGYGIAVMSRKLNQYPPDFVFMQAILKALNQGQKEQSEPRTSRENFCRANRASQVPSGIVRSAELEAARGQRLYREARLRKCQKDSRRRHERPNSCCANRKARRSGRRTSKDPLRAGEGFNRWITKSWKTLIEH